MEINKLELTDIIDSFISSIDHMIEIKITRINELELKGG